MKKIVYFLLSHDILYIYFSDYFLFHILSINCFGSS